MAGYFEGVGRKLLANGYLIIPIKPGHKRPALDSWQSSRLGVADIARYPGHGVGVLCGQGARPLVAIDIDTTDDELASRFVLWCQDNLGATCERVGNAPKILLVYRAAAEGWGKATGAWFDDELGEKHRLEVLGKGQQFVAYHIHPDTGQPYEWVDFFGGIETITAAELPVITEEQVAAAMVEFDRLALEVGLAKVAGSRAKSVGQLTSALEEDPLMAYEPPVGIDLAEAKRLMGYVDNEDYDTWLKVGMGLHHEFAGSVDALALWNEWSSAASNYSCIEDLEKRWDGFGRSGHKPMTARWLLKVGNAGKKETVRAEKRIALEEAKALILSCSDSIDLVGDVAAKVGELADDMALRAELAGLIRLRFKDLTNTLLPVADVRTAMAGGRKIPVLNRAKRQMTEFGNAERMLDHYGDGLSFVPELGAWQAWTGVYWRRAAPVELEHLAKETVRGLADESKSIENDDERVAFFKFCAISQRAMMVRNMVALASSDPRVVVPVEELDKHTHLLGVGNGAVDLRTGKLLPPDRKAWITTITPVEYSETATAPLFEQTVRDVFHGDDEMVSFFQRLVGYSILGQPKEDVLVIPYGSGSNGKSTVLGAIRKVLGEHAKAASADTFLASAGVGSSSAGSAREDVLRLRGARFVYVSEPEEGSELREGLIKSMTGGDPMPARGLYSKVTVEVMPTWVSFMPTNHRPIVKGDDHAIWRRLLLVPFTRNFDSDKHVKKDPHRADKLELEAAGILRWCVQGAIAYQRDGLDLPAKVKDARDEYKRDMDLLAEWLDTCCEVAPGFVASNAELWVSWEHFARNRGELRFISSSKSLGRRLLSRGFGAVRNSHGLRGRGFVGLRVRDSLDA
ncbi:PriCT-2 domain-containing protein [Alcaligenaceae bacterium]|nr:PriCT-2 domain-containing protein [Alcaligenaceae bacterium]